MLQLIPLFFVWYFLVEIIARFLQGSRLTSHGYVSSGYKFIMQLVKYVQVTFSVYFADWNA